MGIDQALEDGSTQDIAPSVVPAATFQTHLFPAWYGQEFEPCGQKCPNLSKSSLISLKETMHGAYQRTLRFFSPSAMPY
jgi:hypothetical protein